MTVDPERTKIFRAAGTHSSLIAPLVTAGRPGGVVLLGRAGSSQPFDDDDLVTIQALADRAALSIESARRYSYEHTMALELQRALLSEPRTPTPLSKWPPATSPPAAASSSAVTGTTRFPAPDGSTTGGATRPAVPSVAAPGFVSGGHAEREDFQRRHGSRPRHRRSTRSARAFSRKTGSLPHLQWPPGPVTRASSAGKRCPACPSTHAADDVTTARPLGGENDRGRKVSLPRASLAMPDCRMTGHGCDPHGRPGPAATTVPPPAVPLCAA